MEEADQRLRSIYNRIFIRQPRKILHKIIWSVSLAVDSFKPPFVSEEIYAGDR